MNSAIRQDDNEGSKNQPFYTLERKQPLLARDTYLIPLSDNSVNSMSRPANSRNDAQENNDNVLLDISVSYSSQSEFQRSLTEDKNGESRKIYLDGQVILPNKQNNVKNETVNSKYNAITFLPYVLYHQFRYFFNLYFLALTVTQFIPALRVGFLLNYLGPLSLVIALSVLKEAYDDILRHKRDNAINNQKYLVLRKDKEPTRMKCRDLRAGMIVQININDRIPADLVVLLTKHEEGHVFIRTDQLDGETDWKLRKAVKLTQSHTKNRENPQDLFSLNACFECEQPSSSIYSFKGVVRWDKVKEPLSIENTIWASTVLASDSIWGLVVYCGKDTRISRNSKVPNTKIGIFDQEVDNLAKILFLMMLTLTAIITVFSNPVLDFKKILITFIRYLVLLSNIIPISMRVNLEFAKLVYCININRDKSIPGTLARNSNIPESLGRIHYLLSDKTGTLTQNEMNFRKLSLASQRYTHEQIDQIQKILSNDLDSDQSQEQQRNSKNNQQLDQKNSKNMAIRRQKEDETLKDLITCLAVCHNVTPVLEENGQRTFQASSPDEIALVRFTEQVGYKLISRDQQTLKIETIDGQLQVFEVLNNFPFSSETKRMGIIVKHSDNDYYTFFVKGADTAIKPLIQDQYKGFVDEECENLAREGLRTLVCAKKKLTQAQYDEWKNLYDDANCRLINRDEAVQKVLDKLEKKVEFLGITGVQDKLQDNVAATVENLRQAGIKVWMLTGDKLETAICTAIGSGLKSATQSLAIIKEANDEMQVKTLLLQFESNASQQLLVIDGISLQTALDNHEKLFFRIAALPNSVVCCRCSPTQKAKITECLRKYSGQVVACVGDGGNDVGMIQSADVGIGIEGKEGKQAALASDFSINQFKHLNDLLLWHGRLSYKRSALLSQFIIHRGLLITSVQAVFMFLFYFLSISVFSGPLMLGYSTIFTMFPVFCIIFDQDVDQNVALQYPALYATLQKGRLLNSKTFFIWLGKAIYQGALIMILSVLLIENAFLKIETTAFTCLIFTQYLMLLTELNHLHIVMVFMVILSLIVYIMTIYFFKDELLVTTLNWEFFGWVLFIMFISWLPLYISRVIMKITYPSDFEKIMKYVDRKSVRVGVELQANDQKQIYY